MKRFSFFNLFKDQKSESSQEVRRKQIILIVAVGLVIGLAILAFQVGFKTATTAKPKVEKPRKAVVGDFVDDRDVWASRLETQMEKMTSVASAIKAKNDLQDKRLKSLEEALIATQKLKIPRPQKENVAPKPIPQKDIVKKSSFSVKAPYGSKVVVPKSTGTVMENPVRSKILHFSSGVKEPFHSVDDYVVSGTHARAVLTTGVVVSTAVQTQSNPQPILLRLGDQGNLPRGFKSKLKDAVLIGRCYGDISSERAMCRIQSLSYVETQGAKKGQTVEKKVEGWVIGEDGAPGLRGRVVDKAGKVAREAMIAGMLSGLSSFFKNEANSSVFPASPFGQTNALNGSDAVKTSLGNGASNALEKLADFSIKRAEAMSPVLVVNPGRVVDVVFKSGFDLRTVSPSQLKRVKGSK